MCLLYRWLNVHIFLKHQLCVAFFRTFHFSYVHNFRTMIDTPANREAMKDADKSTWLPPDSIGHLIRQWSDYENRPENGSFVKLNYKNGTIVPEFL